ncbi:MAG: DUF465 domain-containing protein [Myxococcales bacterium]|nr:DUF465 domain-containing protein [Myxococcales bacterium]
MYVEPHDLAHEFPDHVQLITELRERDAKFRQLFEEYSRCNSEVVKAEEADVPMSDFAFEELKKKRLSIKDEIYALLRAHAGKL